MNLLLTILGVSLLVILHEFGHFAVARLCGMRVLRFSIGFGPVLLKVTRGDTIWQVAAVPLGGFVHIHGMGPGEPVGNDGKSFRDKPLWQRILVIFAGPLANWLIAATCLALLATSVGFRQYDESRAIIGELQSGAPGERAGLRAGDRVLEVSNVPVDDWASLVREVRQRPGEPTRFIIERAGSRHELKVEIGRSDNGGYGVLGALPYAEIKQFPPGQALGAGLRGAWQLTLQQAKMLWGMVSGKVEGELSGIPGIVKMVSREAAQGLSRLFESLAVLSIGLCLLNLLPVPALDGSRLVFLVIEALRRRPVDPVVEGWVHAVGFAALFALMIFVSVRDLL